MNLAKYQDDEQIDEDSTSDTSSSFGFDGTTSEAPAVSLHHHHPINNHSTTTTTEHIPSEEQQLMISVAEAANDIYNNTQLGLQEKIFDGFFICFSQALLDPHLEDLKYKILSNGGLFFDTVTDKVNIVVLANSNNHDKDRINYAIKHQLPIVYENYITDCFAVCTRLDWKQYCVPQMDHLIEDIAQLYQIIPHHNLVTSSEHIHQQIHDINASNYSLKLFVKGSRNSTYTDQFPEVLYTLTWKHKYDARILCSEKLFAGKHQGKIMENLELFLVMGYNDRIPVFTDEPNTPSTPTNNISASSKQNTKKKKQASSSASSTTTTTSVSSKKKGQTRKSEDKATVTISSVHRPSDEEIVIRFGINSLYCSKRFQYMPFRLCVKYTPMDCPVDQHFTIFSPEFKTFVKKDANITKYLNQPFPLNPTVKVITKACTTTTRVEFSKFTTSSSCSSPKQNTSTKKSSKKNGNSQKKRKKDEIDEDTTDTVTATTTALQYPQVNPYDQNGAGTPGTQWPAMSDMNMMYPFLSMFPHHHPSSMYPSIPPHPTVDPNLALYPPMIPQMGMTWMNEPVGINPSGDIFYSQIFKDGIIYKVADLVLVSPWETGEDGEPIENDKQDKDDTIDDRKPIEKFWILKIINLLQTKSGNIRFIGQFFYRWSDLQGFSCDIEQSTAITKSRKNHDLPPEKEVFVSFDMHIVPMSHVHGKCFAKFLDPAQLTDLDRKWLDSDNRFFYQCAYNRKTNELVLLEEQVLKILREDEDHSPPPHTSHPTPMPNPLFPMNPMNPMNPMTMNPMSALSHGHPMGPMPTSSLFPLPSNPFAPWSLNPPPFPTSSASSTSLEPPLKKTSTTSSSSDK
ncbi:hypothetical protein FDP41_001877 [Naegleria fowleri]|uniref:BRCT domain-containing protein n=1 Tax=Naegleria fowleri TaxID=5763 RepID=A0A6A5BNZ6_NAEFO|nr:uncharacterized protein FDP41_001877 [Naegleria fowleri]KAF0978807.1 hypothetical protein FDP41_001877 [Naegleria fowleri]CAG4717980.1 unnamed protein product [Naegleria fowleri]